MKFIRNFVISIFITSIVLIIELLMIAILSGMLTFISQDIWVSIYLVIALFTIVGLPIYILKKGILNKKTNSKIKTKTVPNTKVETKFVNNHKYDFCSIDFETATSDLISACSIGIVAVKDNKIVDEYYTLINPLVDEFSNENIRIHGITKNDVKEAPTFEDIFEIVLSYLENSDYVVAHNAHFDMSVLKLNLKESGKDTDFNYFDSMYFCGVDYSGKSKQLTDMCAFYNVDISNHHNALDDAKACASIVIAALVQSKFNSIKEFLKANTISIKSYEYLKPQEKFKTLKRTSKYTSSVNLDPKNAQHPFFEKSIVITGEFQSYSRNEMIDMILNVGGTVKTSVSKKTDYLVVGQQDLSIVGDDGLSNKQERANELINNGNQINIINELEFLDYFK